MDMQHGMTKLLFGGKLHLSPLNDPKRILDVGAGSGIWAMEMGISNLPREDYGSPANID